MEQPTIQTLSVPQANLNESSCSSKPIISDGYEVSPDFIAMIREQTFSGGISENPYLQLQDPQSALRRGSYVQAYARNPSSWGAGDGRACMLKYKWT